MITMMAVDMFELSFYPYTFVSDCTNGKICRRMNQLQSLQKPKMHILDVKPEQ